MTDVVFSVLMDSHIQQLYKEADHLIIIRLTGNPLLGYTCIVNIDLRQIISCCKSLYCFAFGCVTEDEFEI